jgi:hypothetical protein
MQLTQKQLERFWKNVQKTKYCWIWTGYRSSNRYGSIQINYKPYMAHRIMWLIVYNSMPNLLVLHKCDNPICVNPEHLFLGTQSDNMKDMVSKDRMRQFKIDNTDVYNIKKLLAEGAKCRNIAKIYQVHISTIHEIANGNRRSDVIYP